jgi:hypothetical protein
VAPTYVGSQCQVQVEIGSQSALSLVPGFNDIAKFFNNTNIPKIFNGVVQNLNALLKR